MWRLGVLLLLVLAACSGSDRETATTPSTNPPTTAIPTLGQIRAADLPIIKQFWRESSDAWTASDPLAGFRSIVEHNYPGLGYTPEQCQAIATNPSPPPGDYREDVTLDEASVKRDDRWTMREGALRGQKPQGRVYVMTVHISYSGTGFETFVEDSEVHVTVLNNKAYGFRSCDRKR